ncbi:MAG: hypothetical protein K9K76_10150 [Halanaerobiales bacterium]|nr:hypothetical protein [Halanaerobiales bacterium]
MDKKVYIFGAGASKAVKMPIQNQLLNKIFSFDRESINTNINFLNDKKDDSFTFDVISQFTEFNNKRKILADFIIMNFSSNKIKQFYNDIFGDRNKYNISNSIYSKSIFINREHNKKWNEIFDKIQEIDVALEDIFTLLDKALILKENFKIYSDDNLNDIKKALHDCILYILANNMQHDSDLYKHIGDYFVNERLKHNLEDDPYSIISLNWDILLDHYITNACKKQEEDIQLDFCYYNNDLNDKPTSTLLKASEIYNIKLMKLHGSMNWLMCNNCGRIFTDYINNISLSSLDDSNKGIKCKYCQQLNRNYTLKSSIITPTFLKDFENIHYKNIWHNAYLDLCEADKIIFIGYSLPAADFELRYILKRAIKPEAEIVVILHENDKPDKYLNLVNDGDDVDRSLLRYRLDLPCYRYKAFFHNHKIDFQYNGIRGYFDC